MVKYYTNRELSDRFRLNLAKWKRWSRDFLPPDPLGGFQSGYARQYRRDDAFTIFLGGHLVGELKFSIPAAKRVLSDLFPWLVEKGFYESGPERVDLNGLDEIVESYQIFIRPQTGAGIDFLYTIRGIVSDGQTTFRGHPVRQLLFIEKKLPDSERSTVGSPETVKVLGVTDVYKNFIRLLDAEQHG